MKKSVILLSSGLDSLTNLAIAKKKTNLALALTFDYGHRSATREASYAKKICQFYKVPHQVVELPWLRQITNTALVKKVETLPKLTEADLNNKNATKISAAKVWVPNRNAVFLNIAAAFAESLKAEQIIAGFNAEEAESFPDNSSAFMDTVNASLAFSTKNAVKVFSYTTNMSKKEVLKAALNAQAPLRLLWSCYQGGKKFCWECESCMRLKRALEQNDYLDMFKLTHEAA
jgi:7-cyano-7-deazaguanine synthase